MAGQFKTTGNMVDPEFLARWEPWRHRIRPVQCHLGEAGVCWVKEPYRAMGAPASQHAPRCSGCGGKIGDFRSGPPVRPWEGSDAV